jgi:hypothetical protein
MKRLLLLMFLLALTTMGALWDKEVEWFIVYMPWEQDALELEITELKVELEVANGKAELEITELKAELEVANGLVSSISDFDNLNSQIASLESRRTSIIQQVSVVSQQVSDANAVLQQKIQAANNITSALGTVGAFRVTCCGSMDPTITSNDMAFILKNPPTVGIGDVVIAVSPCFGEGVSVMHRIVRMEGDEYVLRGDNNGGDDPCPVPRSAITWKVLAVAKGVYS